MTKDNRAITLVNRLFKLEHVDDFHDEALNIIRELIDLDGLDHVFPKLVFRHADAFGLYLEHAPASKLRECWFKCLLDLIPLCIEHSYVNQYEVIVKKLKELGWDKLTLCPDIMIRPYLVDTMDRELYKRASKDLRMSDDELDRTLEGEKIEWYDHGGVNNPNNASNYFGYRRAWHLFHYAPEVNKDEFSKHWEDSYYDCTYTAFLHFIVWKQGYKQEEWVRKSNDLEKKSLDEQWALFDSVRS